MSRSNPQENQKNPVVKRLRWHGEIDHDPNHQVNRKCFSYYDKDQKDSPNKGQVEVPLPITFIVLDTLHTVRGYSEKEKAGFFANEIPENGFKTHPLKVYLGDKVEAEGLYKDIKEPLKGKGAKYCQSVYVAMKENGKLVINNLQLWGAAIGPWVEFRSKNNLDKIAVTVKTFTEGQQGRTHYNMPFFEAIPVIPETDEQAKELDRELQAYLKGYFERQNQEQSKEVLSEATKEAPKAESEKKNVFPRKNNEPIPNVPLPGEEGYIEDNGDLPF